MAVLIVNPGKGPETRFYLGNKHVYLGRGNDNDFQIKDQKVSRVHCQVLSLDNVYTVRDMNSRNGVILNGDKIQESELNNGDVVKIGDTELKFLAGDDVVRHQILGTEESKKGEGINETKILSLAELYKKQESNEAIIKHKGESPIEKEGFFLLYQVAKALYRTESLYGFMQQVLNMVFNLVKPDRGAIISFKNGSFTTEHRIISDRSKNKGMNSAPFSTTLMNKVVEEKVAILTTNAASDPRFKAGQSIITYSIHSAMLIPLWQEEDIAGIIYLDNFSLSTYFNEEYLELLTAVAYQITIALMQARLNVKLRETVHSKELTIDTLYKLSESHKKRQDFMSETLKSIKNFLECKEVHFAKFTGKKIEITNPKSSGLPNTVSVPKKGFDFDKMEVINLEALEYDQPYSDFVLAFKDQLQDCGIHAIYPLLNSENNKFFGFFLFSGSGLVAQYDDEKEFLETVCKFLVNFHLG